MNSRPRSVLIFCAAAFSPGPPGRKGLPGVLVPGDRLTRPHFGDVGFPGALGRPGSPGEPGQSGTPGQPGKK